MASRFAVGGRRPRAFASPNRSRGGGPRGGFRGGRHFSDDDGVSPGFRGRGGVHRGRARGGRGARGGYRGRGGFGSPRGGGGFVPRGRGRGGRGRGSPFGKGPTFDKKLTGLFLKDQATVLAVISRVQEGFENDQEKEEYISKALREHIDGYEVNMLLTNNGSRLFCTLLEHANMDSVSSNVPKVLAASGFLSTNYIGSKALHHIFSVLQQRLERQEDSQVQDFACHLADKIMDNMEELLHDSNALTVIEDCFLLLGGMKIYDPTSSAPRFEKCGTIPKAFSKRFDTFTEKLVEDNKFKELFTRKEASNLLRSLLMILKDNDKGACESMANRMMDALGLLDVSTNGELPIGFTDIIYVFSVKNILESISEEHFEEFINRLSPLFPAMAVHPTAKVFLQVLIGACHNKKQYLSVFKSLKPISDEIAKQGLKLLVCLAEAVVKFECKEVPLIQMIKSALGYTEGEKSLAEFLVEQMFDDLKHQENPEEEESHARSPTLLSILFQKMLAFKKHREIATGFVALDESMLLKLACISSTSFIYTAFFTSPAVTDEEKKEMIIKLKENLPSIACNKYGRHAILNPWHTFTIELKQLIASELAKNVSMLLAVQGGKKMAYLLNVTLYLEDPEKWTLKEQSRKNPVGDFSSSFTLIDDSFENKQQGPEEELQDSVNETIEDDEKGDLIQSDDGEENENGDEETDDEEDDAEETDDEKDDDMEDDDEDESLEEDENLSNSHMNSKKRKLVVQSNSKSLSNSKKSKKNL